MEYDVLVENEAKYDSKIDSLQQWIMPDKSIYKQSTNCSYQ